MRTVIRLTVREADKVAALQSERLEAERKLKKANDNVNRLNAQWDALHQTLAEKYKLRSPSAELSEDSSYLIGLKLEDVK